MAGMPPLAVVAEIAAHASCVLPLFTAFETLVVLTAIARDAQHLIRANGLVAQLLIIKTVAHRQHSHKGKANIRSFMYGNACGYGSYSFQMQRFFEKRPLPQCASRGLCQKGLTADRLGQGMAGGLHEPWRLNR